MLISRRNLAGDRNRIAELAASAQPIRDGSVLGETIDSRTHSGFVPVKTAGFVPGPIARSRTRSQQHGWAAGPLGSCSRKGGLGLEGKVHLAQNEVVKADGFPPVGENEPAEALRTPPLLEGVQAGTGFASGSTGSARLPGLSEASV